MQTPPLNKHADISRIARELEFGMSLHLRDMYHVYLNRFKFHLLRSHIIKTTNFAFFVHNERVPGIAK